MKKILFGIAIATFGIACTQKKIAATVPDQQFANVAATNYSCPMHPEVTGKAGDKCPKCKMDLTQTEVYACPMHPEITGKAGDKCSKCKMDLKPVKK
jgi:hypothetical protein